MRDSVSGPWCPSATYRWQLGPGSGFDEVRRRLAYLRRLGVDTLYLSPVFAARRGSRHGYDGVDPSRIDAGRGGARSFRALVRAARRNGLYLLLDIVPNHLAATLENPAWRDVLKNGRRSRFARLFDIDWERSPGGGTAVAVPWLDRPLADAFRDGRVAFVRSRSGLLLRCGGARLPVPVRAFRNAARRSHVVPTGRRTGGRVGAERGLAAANRGDTPEGRRLRERLLAELPYRLVPWYEVASINYRRFADITDLVGVRAESPFGFDHMHRGLLGAVRRGEVDGVRVDHVDGIADPSGYLRRLERALRAAAPGGSRPYVVVEKVLAPGEALPSDWPVSGTTGYEALNQITRVLTPPGAEDALDRAYQRFCTDREGSFADESYRAKRDVEDQLFPCDRTEIVRRLLESDPDRTGPDLPRTTGAIDATLSAVTAALRVYRTYGEARPGPTRSDPWLGRAFREARRREPELFTLPGSDLVVDRLRGRVPPAGPRRPVPDPTLSRWRQWTAAVAAKGIEDTAFYRYVRLLGANEVGGDPASVGCRLDEFHRFMRDRARRWPHGLTATSTHDSKWGEDARARFVALSEWAAEWHRSTIRWHESARDRARTEGPVLPPTPSEEYLVYQAWVATAPPGRAFDGPYLPRLETYLRKALREAKEHSSWLHPDPVHEERVLGFVRERARDRRFAGFRRELVRWVERLDRLGGFYSLAQVVLRVTLPGVPDLYQGSEGWNLALVDPDNRHPVRYDRLERLLRRSDDGTGAVPRRLTGSARYGVREVLKVAVTSGLLRFRREHRSLFEVGEYLPLRERSAGARDAVLAFARRGHREWLVVGIGRGLRSVSGHRGGAPLGKRWRGRTLALPPAAPRRWRDVLTGRTIVAEGPARSRQLRLDQLFSDLPVTVLLGATETTGQSGRVGPARAGSHRRA